MNAQKAGHQVGTTDGRHREIGVQDRGQQAEDTAQQKVLSVGSSDATV